jgi:pimeloyl-ACP methyl ester carboxylesterase
MASSRKPRLTRALAALVAAVAIGTGTIGDAPPAYWRCAVAPPAIAAQVRGKLLILPGVGNTRFHLAGFVSRVTEQLPGFEVEVRTWGTAFLTLRNLRAYEHNIATAEQIAADVTSWRRAHPDEPFYLVGYSGGGGIATLVAAALPAGVSVDRLILVAPAIAPDYPFAVNALPHVREFAVNYASERDLQVGWGTRTFGTIDRKNTLSAGAIGFASTDPRLLQYHWTIADEPFGHRGNHLAYLNPRWQAAKLLPALHPYVGPQDLVARWAQTCEEPS